MPKRLIWDAVGEKFYEMGTKMGVLYPMNDQGSYDNGVAWNGLTAVTESPSGAEETKLYADDIKYASLRSAEEYGFTIEAYTYPEEWEPCDGSAHVAAGVTIGQQKRKAFGFSWVTTKGNDVTDEVGQKLLQGRSRHNKKPLTDFCVSGAKRSGTFLLSFAEAWEAYKY